MTTMPARLGVFRTPYGTWTPYGERLLVIGENPVKSWGTTYAGRLVIGLSVDGVPTYTIEDIIAFTKQNWRGGASVIAQRGVWRKGPDSPPEDPEEEESAQIVLLAKSEEWDKDIEAFMAAVFEFGEQAVRGFQQDVILYEIQERGSQVDAGEITP